MPDFRRIGTRLQFLVGLVVVIGLTAVTLLYTARQERSMLVQHEREMVKVTHSVAEGLQTVMLKGYADVAHEMAMRLRKLGGAVDYRVLRNNGREAFVDNTTLSRVNARLGQERFVLRPDAMAESILPPDSPHLRALNLSQLRQIYYETLPSGERQVTVLEPVRYDEACHECHDDGSAVRGIIKLTKSMRTLETEIRLTWAMSALVLVLGIALILFVVHLISWHAVVLPIRRVTKAMTVVARGDLSASVPVTGRDEIGQMAESFNQMSARLLGVYAGLQDEQNKLTTVILGAREGIVVTDAAGGVVLVNPAASELLGKSEHRICEGGLVGIVDDVSWMEAQLRVGEQGLELSDESAPGVVEYNGKMLSIYASVIRSEAGKLTGSAAMIRDVTEESRLSMQLERLAHTDPLTGLNNRRRFDQIMVGEFDRASRYGTVYSLLMLDVDHFKQFNDLYGHDCGDRVLKALAALLVERVGHRGMVCRYGGEEMAVVLPELGGEGAVRVAETLRAAIEALRVDALKVTASFGVASVHSGFSDASALVAAADAALYRAKAAGRNCVVSADVT